MGRDRYYDAVVIGGGVIGLATAFHLARRGVKVCLIERGMVAAGTSGATMGNLSFHNRMPGLSLDLAKASRQQYEELARESRVNFEFETAPSLMLIEDLSVIDWVKRRVRIQKEAGLDVEFVGPDDLVQLDKTIAPDLAGGVYCRTSARLNPFLLCLAFSELIRKLGGHVLTHNEVTSVIVHHGRVHGVKIGRRKILCDAVVNAAGSNADQVAEMAGVRLSLVRELGTVVVTEKLPRLGVRLKGECTEKDAEAQNVDTLERRMNVHFVFSQTKSGNCLIGRSGQRLGEPASCRLEAVKAILYRACRFMPPLARVTVVRTFSGVRVYSLDGFPILGPVGEPRGYFLAAAFGDKGFSLGPAAAVLLAHTILEDHNVIPAKLLPSRFFETETLCSKEATDGNNVSYNNLC